MSRVNGIKFILAILCLVVVRHSVSADLYVYKPSGTTAASIESLFQKECPNITASVFGRPIDFKKRIKDSKAGSILSLLPVVEHQNGYTVTMRGVLEGENTVPYVFVTQDKPFDLEQGGSVTLGVIDILGPKQMKAYLNDYFGKPVKLKRVNKINDLIFLLTFNVAGAIFIPEPIYAEIAKTTEMQLHALKSDLREGLVTLASLDGADPSTEEVKSCITQLSKELKEILGVEKWQ